MRALALASALLAGTALAQQQVWNPGTGFFNYDGGNNAPGPLYPYMTPGGPAGNGTWPYPSNADPRTTQSGPTYSVAQVGDFDSIAPSYLGDRAYSLMCANFWNYELAFTQPFAGSSYDSSIDMNPSNLSTTGIAITKFSLPPGSTGVNITAYMQKGANDTGTTALGITNGNANCTVNLGTTGFTLTSTMTPYTFTKTGLAPATNYYGGIFGNQPAFNSSTTSDPNVGPIQFKPVGATGLFSGDFWRIGANAKTLWGNNRDYYYTTGVYNAQQGSRMLLDTDATTMAIEMDNAYTATNLSISMAVFVNGLPYTTLQPVQISDINEYQTITLPTGMKEVEIDSSSQIVNGAGFDNHPGTQLVAAYVPATSTTRVVMPPPMRSLVFYGDSICGGNVFPVPVEGGFTAILNRWFNGSVTAECTSGRSLGLDVWNQGAAKVNTQNLSSLVQYITWAHPTDIWIAMGVNDYVQSGATGQFASTAQFGIGLGALLDALHQRDPEAQIYMQSLLITGQEATAINTFTPPNYRTVESTTCGGARAGWCYFVDGTTLLAAADISADHYHPLAGSHSKLARNVMTVLSGVPPATNQPTGYGTQWTSCTLSTGACTVADTTVTANTLILAGTPIGATTPTSPCVVTITAGTSYTVTCTGAASDVVPIVRSN